jgi:hypothetical protein
VSTTAFLVVGYQQHPISFIMSLIFRSSHVSSLFALKTQVVTIVATPAKTQLASVRRIPEITSTSATGVNVQSRTLTRSIEVRYTPQARGTLRTKRELDESQYEIANQEE